MKKMEVRVQLSKNHSTLSNTSSCYAIIIHSNYTSLVSSTYAQVLKMICIFFCKIILIHFSINITHPPPKPPPEGAPLFCFIGQGSKQNMKCKYKQTHRNEKIVCTYCSFIKSNINIPELSMIYSPRYHVSHIYIIICFSYPAYEYK